METIIRGAEQANGYQCLRRCTCRVPLKFYTRAKAFPIAEWAGQELVARTLVDSGFLTTRSHEQEAVMFSNTIA